MERELEPKENLKYCSLFGKLETELEENKEHYTAKLNLGRNFTKE